jgi:hypothetical protein
MMTEVIHNENENLTMMMMMMMMMGLGLVQCIVRFFLPSGAV